MVSLKNSDTLKTIDYSPPYYSYVPFIANILKISSFIAIAEARTGAILGKKGFYGALLGAGIGFAASFTDYLLKQFISSPKNILSNSVWLAQSMAPIFEKFSPRATYQNHGHLIKLVPATLGVLEALYSNNNFDLDEKLKHPIEAFYTLNSLFNLKNDTHLGFKQEFNNNFRNIILLELTKTATSLVTVYFLKGDISRKFCGLNFNEAIANIDSNNANVNQNIFYKYGPTAITESLKYAIYYFVKSSINSNNEAIKSKQSNLIKASLPDLKENKLESNIKVLLEFSNSEMTKNIDKLSDHILLVDFLSEKSQPFLSIFLLYDLTAKIINHAASNNINDHFYKINSNNVFFNNTVLNYSKIISTTPKDIIDVSYIFVSKANLVPDLTYDAPMVISVDKMLELLVPINAAVALNSNLIEAFDFVRNFITSSNPNQFFDQESKSTVLEKEFVDFLKTHNIKSKAELLEFIYTHDLFDDQHNNDNAITSAGPYYFSDYCPEVLGGYNLQDCVCLA